MINSIQRFGEKGIKNLEEVVGSFVKSPTDISGFVLGIQEQVLKLALDIIGETLTVIMKLSKPKEKAEMADC